MTPKKIAAPRTDPKDAVGKAALEISAAMTYAQGVIIGQKHCVGPLDRLTGHAVEHLKDAGYPVSIGPDVTGMSANEQKVRVALSVLDAVEDAYTAVYGLVVNDSLGYLPLGPARARRHILSAKKIAERLARVPARSET